MIKCAHCQPHCRSSEQRWPSRWPSACTALAVGGGIRGKRVLISGSGPIGLLTAAAAAADGAAEVVCADVLAGPLQRARSLGEASPVPIGTVQIGVEDLPDSHFDVTLECAGVPQALHGLLLATRRAGVLVQVGNLPDETRPINLAPLVSKEIQLRGTFRFNTEIDAAITLLDQNPQIEQVVTHVLPIEDVDQAFAIAANSEISGKVLVEVGAFLTEIPAPTLRDRPWAAPHIPGVNDQFVVCNATVRALTGLSGARTLRMAARRVPLQGPVARLAREHRLHLGRYVNKPRQRNRRLGWAAAPVEDAKQRDLGTREREGGPGVVPTWQAERPSRHQ